MPVIDGRMLIDGERVDAASGDVLTTPDPATGEVLAEVAAGGAADVDAAVSAARACFVREWSAVTPLGRASILFELAGLLRRQRDELADLESRDVGKPRREALADVDGAAAYFSYYAGIADKVLGDSIPLGPGRLDYTVREPIGVSAQIVPWNYPLQMAARGVAPALACGNTVVVKPAVEAGLSIARLAELAVEAGLPRGAWNVVTGNGPDAGAALAGHPEVGHVTFTGSVPTGVSVMEAAARNVVPVTLELGGKSPMVVFADADLEQAVGTTAAVITQNAGQTCSAASRVLVDERVHDRVVELLARRLADVDLGRGVDDPGMGPVVSERQLHRVLGAIDEARGRGTELVVGGRRGDREDLRGGFFVEPTLFDSVDPASPLGQQEVFGPVLGVTTFSDVDEAVALANGTPYGLVCGVWTKDLATAHRVAAAVQSGQVFVNGYGAGGGVALPFGGVKKSGFGREKGLEALHNYTAVKNVLVYFG